MTSFNFKKHVLITGGAGFIGSHVVRHFVKTYPHYRIINIDALTYAGNLENLKDICQAPNYHFEKLNILDAEKTQAFFIQHHITDVIHLAAESHVDRSIFSPLDFVYTNIIGTVHLLNIAKEQWKHDIATHRFYQISTDEVYGALGETGYFTELTPYHPNSPYSASKASADHFVRAYGETYQLPFVLSHCSNNYGPYHFPEKLIPLLIHNIIEKKPLPIYGDGLYTRDWLFVEDHAKAIDIIFHKGRNKETYNIGGNSEKTNMAVVALLCSIMDKKLGRKEGESASLITFVKDRQGHDRRYAIDASKIKNELGWTPTVTFEEGILLTIDWYLTHQEWTKNITTGAYQQYYDKMYMQHT